MTAGGDRRFRARVPSGAEARADDHARQRTGGEGPSFSEKTSTALRPAPACHVEHLRRESRGQMGVGDASKGASRLLPAGHHGFEDGHTKP